VEEEEGASSPSMEFSKFLSSNFKHWQIDSDSQGVLKSKTNGVKTIITLWCHRAYVEKRV
jgi:hypothetical protein